MNRVLSLFLSFSLIFAPISNSFAQAEMPEEIEKGGYDFYFKQALLLINSTIGASLIQSCPQALARPSAAIWMGGGLSHILLELLHKSDQEQKLMMKRKKLKEIGENIRSKGSSADKSILEAQRDESAELRDFIKVRRNWMIVIETIYLTAAGFAIVEVLQPDGATVICKGYGKNWVGTVLSSIWSAGTASQEGGVVNKTASYAMGAVSLLSLLGEKAKKISDKIGSVLVAAITTPAGRAITFSASAVTGGIVTIGLQDRYHKAETNTKKMSEAIDKYVVENDGAGSGFDDGSGSTKIETVKTNQSAAGQIKSLGQINKIKKCFQIGQESIEHSESACKNSIKLKTPSNLPSGFPTLSAVAGLTNQMANALASGDNEAAERLGNEIGSYASKVKEINKKLQAKINEDLKKAGKKPIEFDKEVQKQLSEMGRGFSNNESPQLAAFQSSVNPTMNETKEEKNAEQPTGNLSSPVIDLPQNNLSESGQTIAEESAKIAETPTLEESLNEFEVPVEDISRESRLSIFEQVSNRYLLNYTRIFESKKSVEERKSTLEKVDSQK